MWNTRMRRFKAVTNLRDKVLAPGVGVEPASLILIQSQAGPAGRPTRVRPEGLGQV